MVGSTQWAVECMLFGGFLKDGHFWWNSMYIMLIKIRVLEHNKMWAVVGWVVDGDGSVSAVADKFLLGG